MAVYYWTPSATSSKEQTTYDYHCDSNSANEDVLRSTATSLSPDGSWLITYPDTVTVELINEARFDVVAVLPTGSMSLPDYIRAHPDAADGVIEVTKSYIDEYPDFPLTFDSPIPGLSLDPAPNGNQWLGNPFFDPLLDTDTDSWPDWFEYDLYSDPSNPASQPPSTADPDDDGYDNAAERDVGTDPTDPNGRPDVDVDHGSDGDGIKDSADPCPSDPTNMCQPEEDS